MKFELEERTCACGCGYKFKVLPTSKQKYAAQHHSLEDKSTQHLVKFKGKLLSPEKRVVRVKNMF